MDRRFEAFRPLLGDDEKIVWFGASRMEAGFRWVKVQVVLGLLALSAAMGIEPIPMIASVISEAVFGNFGVSPGDATSGKAFGLDVATVVIRVALAGWAAIHLFGAFCIVLSKGNEIHMVTDRRLLSVSGKEASAARLSEIESVGIDASGGQGSLVLNVSGKVSLHMIGLDDPMGALLAISKGMALTRTVVVEMQEEFIDDEVGSQPTERAEAD